MIEVPSAPLAEAHEGVSDSANRNMCLFFVLLKLFHNLLI